MKRPKRSGAVVRSAHLLDTSTLLWALGEPERLSAKARRVVEAGENVVSVASYWEVVIKVQKGLLSIGDLAAWWRRATELTSARILHIRPSHITELAALPILHKHPFDRILIAQARGRPLALSRATGRSASIPFRLSGSPQGLGPRSRARRLTRAVCQLSRGRDCAALMVCGDRQPRPSGTI